MYDPCMMDRGDVSIEPLPKELCSSCNEEEATHIVRLDVRNAGVIVGVEKCCWVCAQELAEEIRKSLPEEQEGEENEGTKVLP